MDRRPGRDVAGLVVAITGGAQGIGRQVALDLAAAGARVAIGDLDGDRAGEVAGELGVGSTGSRLDVTDPTSFADFLDGVERDLGPIDVLVNNAGVMWVGGFESEPEGAIRRQVEVNLLGVIRGVQLGVARMRPRRRGQIVTVASVASLFAPPGEATYAATKHGVLGYLTAVRAELRRSGIQITAVMPAVVDTPLAAGTRSGAVPRLSPEQVSAAVISAIRRPRFHVVVPGHVALLHRLATLLPIRVRDVVLRFTVPDQVRAVGDRSSRADYEREHFTA